MHKLVATFVSLVALTLVACGGVADSESEESVEQVPTLEVGAVETAAACPYLFTCGIRATAGYTSRAACEAACDHACRFQSVYNGRCRLR